MMPEQLMSNLANLEDQNGNGIEATCERDEIRLATDSYNPLGRVARLSPDVAEALGYRLIDLAIKARNW